MLSKEDEREILDWLTDREELVKIKLRKYGLPETFDELFWGFLSNGDNRKMRIEEPEFPDDRRVIFYEVQALAGMLLEVDNIRHAIWQGDVKKLFYHAWELGTNDQIISGHNGTDKTLTHRLVRQEAGKQHGYLELRKSCIQEASSLWQQNPEIRIGDMTEVLYQKIQDDHPEDIEVSPDISTIRKWLDRADKDGQISIPAIARKRGRPSEEK